MTSQGPGFGIYIHWPFCAAKCPYCDFNSHVRHAPVDQARFAAGFARELAHFAGSSAGQTVTSIFIGGGTPSLMAPATLDTILDAVRRLWPVADDAEISMEANPSSVEAGRFRDYRAAGVNRLSLGVQALDDHALKALGRLHDLDEARRAIELARATFPRLSFDLIYARPDQTPADWRAELEQAIGLAADHLSLYQLTLETGTPYSTLATAGRLTIPGPDAAAALYELTQEITARHGLPAYEVSNHAAPGAECRHNLTYWRYGDYVGVGPGAHGRIGDDSGRLATAAERRPEDWLAAVEKNGHGLVEELPLTREEQGDEFLLMGLRLVEGIDPRRFEAIAGRSFNRARIDDLVRHGMVREDAAGRLAVTPGGMMVLDAVVADLAA